MEASFLQPAIVESIELIIDLLSGVLVAEGADHQRQRKIMVRR